MTDLLFDKLAYKDKLTASGVPEAAARAHADALDEALRESVATKPFVAGEISRLEHRIDLAVRDMTIRIGGMMIAAVAILIGVKFFG
jgi:hypothetical protein